MQTLLQDLRFGLRGLRRRPGLSLAMIVTLGLGIGGTTAVFSLLQGLLLRPLDYPEPERLVRIYGEREGRLGSLSGPELEFLDEHGSTFEAIAGVGRTNLNLTGEGEPERVLAARVSPSLFPLLGVRPLAGRTLTDEEAVDGGDQVAVISEGLWRRRYGADPDLVGRVVLMDDEPVTVVGILPASFRYPSDEVAVWRPLVLEGDLLGNPSTHMLEVLGRLAPGVSLEAAAEDVAAVHTLAEQTFNDQHRPHAMTAVSYPEEIRASNRPGLLMLQGAVAAVLLICCVNIANLLLVAGQRRRQELVLRGALGAGRRRLMGQLLVESLLLAALGGGLGLLLAPWTLDLLWRMIAGGSPRAEAVVIDATVLAFAAGVTLLSGFLFGLFPAFRATRLDLRGELGRGATEAAGRGRERTALVVLEVALSVAVLVVVGLLARSLYSLSQVDPGFDPKATVSLSLSLPETRYGDGEQQARFVDELIRQLETLPQVESAAVSTLVPFSGSTFRIGVTVPATGSGEEREASPVWRAVTPKLFSTLGIPVLQGRGLTQADLHPNAPPVLVVSETFARQLWPDGEALGRRMEVAYNHTEFEVVGVAGDVRHASLEDEPLPEIFTPYSKTPWPLLSVVTRLEGRAVEDPALAVAVLREAVWSVDPDQPVFDVRRLSTMVDESLSPRRSLLSLLSTFAALALALAAVGIYAVISTAVGQRTREMGIRKALGAPSAELLRLLLTGGMGPVAAGVAVGLVAAALGHRLIASQLYGVEGIDPLTYAAMAAVVTAVAAAAVYLPARRAAAIDPLEALRHD